MFRYLISWGNPEGNEGDLQFIHEKKFTSEELKPIVARAVKYGLQREQQKRGYSSIHGLFDYSLEMMIKFMGRCGFAHVITKYEACFYFSNVWRDETLGEDFETFYKEHEKLNDKWHRETYPEDYEDEEPDSD